MIKIGDIVFVQNKGVCELLNITKNAFVGADKTKVYYVLKPVGSQNNMMIYFPTDSNVHIRKLCSKLKAISIFENFKDLDDLKFSDAEEKHNLFNQVSQKGELEDRARLLKMLLVQKNKTARKLLSEAIENKKDFVSEIIKK